MSVFGWKLRIWILVKRRTDNLTLNLIRLSWMPDIKERKNKNKKQ